MWSIWLKQGNMWIESSIQYIEESECRKAAAQIKRMFYIDQVFIQFNTDELIEITDW